MVAAEQAPPAPPSARLSELTSAQSHFVLGPELGKGGRWVGEAGGPCDTWMTAATPQADTGWDGFYKRQAANQP